MHCRASVLLEDSKCPEMVVNCKCIYKGYIYNTMIMFSVHSTDNGVLFFQGRDRTERVHRGENHHNEDVREELLKHKHVRTFLAAWSLPLRLTTSHYPPVVHSGKMPHAVTTHHFCIGAPLLLHHELPFISISLAAPRPPLTAYTHSSCALPSPAPLTILKHSEARWRRATLLTTAPAACRH